MLIKHQGHREEAGFLAFWTSCSWRIKLQAKMEMMGWSRWGWADGQFRNQGICFRSPSVWEHGPGIQQDCTVVKVQPQPGFTPASDMFAR